MPLIPLLALCAAGCARPLAPPPVDVVAMAAGGDCRFQAEGRTYPDLQSLTAAARRWRGRRAQVKGGVETPYKCFGGALFALQRAGLEGVTFVAEPSAPERR
jgi:hypothetical protein